VSQKETTEENLARRRHSFAHVLAYAVTDLFPGTKLGVGPATADGFYYDFLVEEGLQESDLEKIATRMREIISGSDEIYRREISLDEAREIFAEQPYKLDLIDRLVELGQGDSLSVYEFGPFVDLCRGPHVEKLSKLDPTAFELTGVSGAYWRGDTEQPMLQRVRATGWRTRKELRKHIEFLKEAAKRDHRNLGTQLDLFSTSDEVGPGLTLWHPKGAMIRFLAERFSQDAHVVNDYQWVHTPHIGRSGLWETSGHLDFYKEGMYGALEIDGEKYYLKPMSCPFHVEIFKQSPKSYRELPVRYAEFAAVYRYELSGTLSGLTRVRGFTQDDAHVFCTDDQVFSELTRALEFSLYILRTFGLSDFKAYLATRPEDKYIGEIADWDRAIERLRQAVEHVGLPYEYDEGGGAFYGPKIDIKIEDSLRREWQLSTVQFDFNLPQRFDLAYIGSDGTKHRPFMIHRALFGSTERFVAMLIEHFAGALPLWLTPCQVGIIPVADRHHPYAEKIQEQLKQAALRVELDRRSERMNAKVRDFEMQKVPFIIVIGDREVEDETIALRTRGKKGVQTLSVEDFSAQIKPDLDLAIPRRIFG